MTLMSSRRYSARALAVAAALALGVLPLAGAAAFGPTTPAAALATQACQAGWSGFPYLNHSYTSAQGCTDNEPSGASTLTLGDTSGTIPVPAQLVLNTSHCDSTTYAGRCVYYMTGDIIIPAGTSLTVDSGVTLLDQNTGWCLNDGDTDGAECDSNGNMVVNGSLILQPGAALLASRRHGGKQGVIQVNNGGRLSMNGTAAHPIVVGGDRSTPQAGDWGGLYINGGSASLSYAHLSDAGGGISCGVGCNYPTSLYVAQGSGPVGIANSSIDDSANYGLELANPVTLANDTFTGNGGRAIQYDVIPSDLSILSHLAAHGNGDDSIGIYVRGGYGAQYNGRGTWPNAGLPYHINSDGVGTLTIDGHLTLGAGVTMRVCHGCRLSVNANGYGGAGVLFTIHGTAREPVTLTSDARTPKAGDWAGLCLGNYNSSASLSYLHLSYAGMGNCGAGAIYVMQGAGSTSIANSSIDHSAGYGLELEGTATLRNDTFAHNLGRAIQYDTVPSDLRTLSHLSAHGNGDDSIGIYVRGGYGAQYNGRGTWPNAGLPYHINSDGVGTLTIDGHLTLGAGVTLRVCHGCRLSVNANGYGGAGVVFTIGGTAHEPVTLTSDARAPKPGDWGGLCLGNYDSSASLSYLHLSYAGTGNCGAGAIYAAQGKGTVKITHTTIDYSAGNDVELNGVQTVLRDDSFGAVPHGSYGVVNDGGPTVDAAGNWWGDRSGPSGAGPGTGVAVGKGVTFKPWLTASI